MGSKRSKKVKPELDSSSDASSSSNTQKKAKLKQDLSVPLSELENSETNGVKKGQKRKKKSESSDEVPNKVPKQDPINVTKKIKMKKKSVPISIKSEDNGDVYDREIIRTPIDIVKEECRENEIDGFSDVQKSPLGRKKYEPITWPNKDVNELIDRMEKLTPQPDSMAFKSTVEKIDWSQVAFDDYTADMCKETWSLVQRRVRSYRLLTEVLTDARNWINAPKQGPKTSKGTLQKSQKTKKKVPLHPDMPARPLSSYFLFYMKKKDKVLRENPGIDASMLTKLVGQLYQLLPQERRKRYEEEAAANKLVYAEKLNAFYEMHPDLRPPPRSKTAKSSKPLTPPATTVESLLPNITIKEEEVKPKVEKPPKVEKTSKLPKQPKSPQKKINDTPKRNQTPIALYLQAVAKDPPQGVEKSIFREQCKIQFKQLPDAERMHWITLAEQDLARYQQEAIIYKESHPDYEIITGKNLLTREDIVLKERVAGKPLKPPNSAYGLYSKNLLQGDEIKSVNPKDRMNYCAEKWRQTSDEEKIKFRDEVAALGEKYKQEYEAYLSTLTEEEKLKLSQAAAANKINKSKKQDKPKCIEPEQPPISACKYFCSLYTGAGESMKAWRALGQEGKKKWEEELVKKKQAYIIEFEKFLKSLSKDELEAFSKQRQQQDDSSDCSSSGSESEGDGEDSETE